ncbi:hypothetical protein GCM10011371_33990 [Novosphingobium marinum]|nr:hypothetical protein GCM10011371_33990 [Novosphingobium marinum]
MGRLTELAVEVAGAPLDQSGIDPELAKLAAHEVAIQLHRDAPCLVQHPAVHYARGGILEGEKRASRGRYARQR